MGNIFLVLILLHIIKVSVLVVYEKCYNLGYIDWSVVVIVSPPTPHPFCCFNLLKLQLLDVHTKIQGMSSLDL